MVTTALPYNNSIVITAGGGGAGVSFGGSTYTLGDYNSQTNLNLMNPYITFSLIKANGGTIVQCRTTANETPDLYLIPETAKNFDKELGKIISMHLLKTKE